MANVMCSNPYSLCLAFRVFVALLITCVCSIEEALRDRCLRDRSSFHSFELTEREGRRPRDTETMAVCLLMRRNGEKATPLADSGSVRPIYRHGQSSSEHETTEG